MDFPSSQVFASVHKAQNVPNIFLRPKDIHPKDIQPKKNFLGKAFQMAAYSLKTFRLFKTW